jgi:hypothetical protein
MTDIVYPDNINVNGLLSFPVYTEDNIAQLKEWRTKRGIAAPRFPDRIGFQMLLTQAQHDKVVANLQKVYLPFARTLQSASDKKKGIDPKLVVKLEALVKAQDWSENNLPIRELTEKDQANLEKNNIEGIVSKLKVAGPANDGPITIKALFKEDDETQLAVTTLSAVHDLLPEGQQDQTALWWGASWPFKTSVRFNAYSAANFGVAAYVRTAYLFANQELPVFGAGDAAVLEDGDDWADD